MPVNAREDDGRSTSHLLVTLGQDVRRCHRAYARAQGKKPLDAPDPIKGVQAFHARQLSRAIFAYIEAVTFSTKVTAVGHCIDNGIEISSQEHFFALDVDHALNEKGVVVERRAMIRLASNVRFAFALAERASGSPNIFDHKADWWLCLLRSIKVRDRLTHPKMPEDIDLAVTEMRDIIKAWYGFEEIILRYASLLKPRDAPGGAA